MKTKQHIVWNLCISEDIASAAHANQAVLEILSSSRRQCMAVTSSLESHQLPLAERAAIECFCTRLYIQPFLSTNAA